MIVGCAIWGSMADYQGRRVAIMLSLLVDFIAAVSSSVATSFNAFLLCRFFNGFGIIGATSLIFSYLGEFVPRKSRDAILGKLEIFWTFGMIVLPGVAWSLLNRTLLQFTNKEEFSPWRIFVCVSSLPNLISLSFIYFLPETPKFLMIKGKQTEARMVFQKMFALNTGKPFYCYPVISLEKEYEAISNNNDVVKLRRNSLLERIKLKIIDICSEMLTMCTQPYLQYLLIVCFADFGLMASYYTLMMWFPEIFKRFMDFRVAHPGVNAGVCTVSASATRENNPFMPSTCDPAIEDGVFIETLIIAVSCLPTSVCLGYLMKKLGKRVVVVLGMVLSGLATLLLNIVQSMIQTLILSCVFEALASILEAVIFCIIVDLFPTNLRAIALAITATAGRIGAISGNIVLGSLIDMNCIIPIYLFSGLLIASGILCLALPKSDSYTVLH